jgi:hypothetical protein
MSSKLNLEGDLLPLLGRPMEEEVCQKDPEEDPLEYSKKTLQNFHRKSVMDKNPVLKEESSINKSFNLLNLGQSMSYRGSISDIKNFTDNLTINSGDLKNSSSNLNFFSSNKKELSQIINNVFITNKCKWNKKTKITKSEPFPERQELLKQHPVKFQSENQPFPGPSDPT